MDYKEKYEAALERARMILCNIPEGESCKDIETIFPELAESEDERIRKWILEKVQGYADSGIPCPDEIQTANKALAWLEKQKEEEGYEAIPIESTLEYKVGKHAGFLEGLNEGRKQKEQKKPTLDDPDLYGDWDNDLLEEIHSWLGHLDGKYTPYTIDDIKLTARHFVEWQKQKEQKPEHFDLKAGKWYICHRAFCCRADHLTVKEGERFMCEKDGVVKGFVIKEPEKYFKECSAPAPMEDEPHWKPSEDEERLINTSISFLKDFADKGYENAVECIDWLKSKLNGNPGK